MADSESVGMTIDEVPEEARQFFDRSAKAVIIATLWDIRGHWPKDESPEHRQRAIMECSTFLSGALMGVVRAHAAMLVMQAAEEANTQPDGRGVQ